MNRWQGGLVNVPHTNGHKRAGRAEPGAELGEFQPPAEDVAFVDARGLTLQQIDEEEVRPARMGY